MIFLEAWRSRDRAVWVEGSILPWLFGIAKNVVRGSRRSLRRYRAALDRFVAMHPADVSDDPFSDVDARLDDRMVGRHVSMAMAQLTPKDREIATVCLLGGNSTARAAEILGIPEGTAKSRLAHARVALRALLRSGESDLRSDPRSPSGHEGDRRGGRVEKATAKGHGR